jgi:hypothetical protein
MNEHISGTIAGWPISADVPPPQIVVVQKTDLEEVRYFVAEGAIPAPSALYYVVPEAKTYLAALQYWLKYTQYRTLSVECDDRDVSSFFAQWETVCAAPFSVSARELTSIVERAPLAVKLAIPSLENVCDCLSLAYVKVSHALLCTEGAYSDFRPARDTRSWWRQTPSKAAQLANDLLQLEGFSNRSVGLRPIVDHATKVGSLVSKLGQGDIRAALDAAACCCFKAADIQHGFGQTASAVLLLHRALDFFLQARCFENGLLRESGDGVEFVRPNADKPVSVLNCYSALVDNQVYVRKKRLRESIWACNEIRNNLFLTHSVYGVTVSYAKKYRDAIELALREIDEGASRRLLSATSDNIGGVSLHPVIIFSLEQDLGSCVVKVEGL